MINRRSFLLGTALTAPAVIRTPGLLMPVHSPVLRLWGDGIHCDAEAIQALADGRKVRFGDRTLQRFGVPMPLPDRRTYLVKRAVHFGPTRALLCPDETVFFVPGRGGPAVTWRADGSMSWGAPQMITTGPVAP